MKLKQIIESINKNDIYKKLEKDNRSTLPKIPSQNIFKNNPVVIAYKDREDTDELFADDEYLKLPIKSIPIDDIVPSQRSLTVGNLKRIDNYSGVYLLKMNNKYYVLDGHHRIANQILFGDNFIKAHVYETK